MCACLESWEITPARGNQLIPTHILPLLLYFSNLQRSSDRFVWGQRRLSGGNQKTGDMLSVKYM